MDNDLVLIIVVATALAFDFTNGFHDTANVVATSISTHALSPRVAVAMAAVLNFAGAFISIAVATTIAEGIVDNSSIDLGVLFAALLGAITWNLITWSLKMPSSSSHALIGGIVGAAVASGGFDAVKVEGVLSDVVFPAFLAPVIAGAVALVATVIAFRLRARMRESAADNGFRVGQIGTASLVALAHGTNDAQKTMGVIALALIVHGSLDGGANLEIPLWVKVSAALSISIGTYMGGWRIIKTMGKDVTDISPPQGFSAEGAGASVLLAASYYGFPLSTTQVISGSVFGAGVGKKLSAVHWGVVGQMVTAWIFTLPAAALVAAGAFELSDFLGEEVAGPIVLAIIAIAAFSTIYVVTQRNPVRAEDFA